MIVRGHQHLLRADGIFERPSGGRVIHSHCVAENGPENCRLEEERVFNGDQPVSIRYRYGGLWFSALELLRLLPLGVAECPECHGEKMLATCEHCFGVGVVEAEGEGKLLVPNLKVHA